MQSKRHVRLFRHGRNQAVRIPREFEMDADEAVLHQDGDRLILEPIKRVHGLSTLLASWEPLDETLSETTDVPAKPEDIFDYG